MRESYTITPIGGVIRFRLMAANVGSVCIITGGLGVPVINWSRNINAPTGFTAGTANTGAGLINMEQAPIYPDAGIGADISSFMPAYRPIASVCNVSYTGSSMLDNGVVTIRRVTSPYRDGETASVTYNATATDVVPCVSISPALSSLGPDSIVGPAKRNYSSRVGLGQYNMVPTSGCVCSRDAGAGVLSSAIMVYTNDTVSSGSYALCHSPSPDASSVEYSYSGLDASASITIDCRYCVEYTVSPSSAMMKFSGYSDAGDPSLLAQMKTALRDLPVATIANAVANLAPKSILGKAASFVAGLAEHGLAGSH